MGLNTDVYKIKGIPNTVIPILTVGDFEPEVKQFFDTVEKWLNSDKGIGLFIVGGSGCGKTTLGSYAVKRMLEAGKSARRIHFTDFKTEIEANFGVVSETLLKDKLIFIDGLGSDMGRMGDRIEGFIRKCVDMKIKIVLSGEYPSSPKFREYTFSAFYPVQMGNTDIRKRVMNKEFS